MAAEAASGRREAHRRGDCSPPGLGGLARRPHRVGHARPSHAERTLARTLARGRPGRADRRAVRHAGAEGRAARARSRAHAAVRACAGGGRRRRLGNGTGTGGKRLGRRRAAWVGADARARSAELVPGASESAGARRARCRRHAGSRPPDHAHVLAPGARDLRQPPAGDRSGCARSLAPPRRPYAVVGAPGGRVYASCGSNSCSRRRGISRSRGTRPPIRRDRPRGASSPQQSTPRPGVSAGATTTRRTSSTRSGRPASGTRSSVAR